MTSQLDLSKLYTRSKMKRTIAVPSSELTTKFDENLIIKLRNEVEGKCNREGYIEKGSIEIIDHGTLDTEVIRYRGDVRVRVTFTGKVVNPVFGEIVECQVRRFNDFGIMATAGPLNIVIPFSDRKEVTFNVGQILRVKVVETTLVLNDDHIDVYATFYDEKTDRNTATDKPVDDDILDSHLEEEANDIESDEDQEDFEETGNELEEEDEYEFESDENEPGDEPGDDPEDDPEDESGDELDDESEEPDEDSEEEEGKK